MSSQFMATFLSLLALAVCVSVVQIFRVSTAESKADFFQSTVFKNHSLTPNNQTNEENIVSSVLVALDVANDTLPRDGIHTSLFNKNVDETVRANRSWIQSQARAALSRMEERNAFETPLTTRASVLEKSFPMIWDSCTLHNALEQKTNKSEPLQIVLLGASCSSRAADNCSLHETDPLYGRYSDYLQRSFDQESAHNKHSLNFQVLNMAQGSTGSTTNGLTMDELVDNHKADVLIWEFVVNDAWTLNAVKIRPFHFWLTRVEALFAEAGRPRPPILLLIFWEFDIASKPAQIIKDGLDTPLKGAWSYIDHYREQHGWNFQVASVGSAVINRTAVAENSTTLVDDSHHPNCQSVKLVSDMLLHAFYSDLDACGDSQDRAISIPPTQESSSGSILASVNLTNDSLLQGVPSEFQGLWEQLMRADVRVGSFSSFRPKLEGHSKLRLGNLQDMLRLPQRVTELALPSREDRKMGLLLPRCSQQWIHVTLFEPLLEWLGVGYKRIFQAKIAVAINGVSLDRKRSFYKKMSYYIRIWVHVPGSVSLAENYTVSLCMNSTRGKLYFHHLVGVMGARNGTIEQPTKVIGKNKTGIRSGNNGLGSDPFHIV